MELTPAQHTIRDHPASGTLFVEGAAGTGKTTAAAHHLLALLTSGIPGGSVLIFAPQPAALLPYQRAIRASGYAGTLPAFHTIGSLSRWVVGQGFPLIAEAAGFGDPAAAPTFLSLETAQYVMARLVDPLAFAAGVRVDPQRIFSQILDNLNKAALVGFPHTTIAERLKGAAQQAASFPAYDQAQFYAERFRAYCLEHSLIDFSLQLELFQRLWTDSAAAPIIRPLVFAKARHLIVDNVEEDAPTAHALIGDLLAAAASAVIVQDSEGGYRRFLGADPISAAELRGACDRSLTLDRSFVMSPPVAALAEALGGVLGGQDDRAADAPDPRTVIGYADTLRYYPEMLDWTADTIAGLVRDHGVPPGEIAVLAPFMSDALRFSLLNRLEARGIPARSHRPSRSLREEPAVECLLTWAQFAHPEWRLPAPTPEAVAYALMLALGGVAIDPTADADPSPRLDLVRARLLAAAAYQPPSGDQVIALRPFAALPAPVRERVTYTLGERYEVLRTWLEGYQAAQNPAVTAPVDPAPVPVTPPKPKRGRKPKAAPVEPLTPLEPAPPQRAELDQFFSLLYGEVLSRRGFGFYGDFIAAAAAASLIDSARGFRTALTGKAVFEANLAGKTLAEEYVEMVRGGVIANHYLQQAALSADAVLLAPAYTFLNHNLPVTVQFWLDIGSRGWFERLYQPLTHPYVLAKHWDVSRQWTDEDEDAARRETLRHLVYGLLRRCRGGLYLGLSQLSESGREETGELLLAFSRLFRRLQAESADQPGGRS